jgi:hypothetical protein
MVLHPLQIKSLSYFLPISGILVIFRRPGEFRITSQTSEVTPRSLSALSAYAQTQGVHPVIPVHTPQQATPYIMFNSRLATSPNENVSISNFYNFKDRVSCNWYWFDFLSSLGRYFHSLHGVVTLLDFSRGMESTTGYCPPLCDPLLALA